LYSTTMTPIPTTNPKMIATKNIIEPFLEDLTIHQHSNHLTHGPFQT
jgi:hypothetical protein